MYLTRATIDTSAFPRTDCYPFDLPVLRDTPILRFVAPVTFFLGENGSGKSTLLEAIARRCHIHIWTRSKRHIAHKNPHETDLYRYMSVRWAEDRSVPGGFFSAETFRDWAEFLDDVSMTDPGQLRYFGGRTILDLSHGEGILNYVRGRYRVPGIYFLDEPEAALSPAHQVELVRILHRFAAQGHAQFLVATHSPILLALPGARIAEFRGTGIHETTYEQTEHFRLYREFLNDPGRFLNE